MRRIRKPRRFIIFVALCVLFGTIASFCTRARACDIPVFQYALAYWEADLYEVVVFHRGALSEARRAMLGTLARAGAAESGPANLRTTAVALDAQTAPQVLALWEAQRRAGATPPWMVLRYPQARGPGPAPPPAWAGALNRKNIALLIESPKRRELAERLLDGQCAVWVLLECGRKADDDAAAAALRTALDRAEKTLVLPTPTAQDETTVARGPEDLRVEFSVLRVARDDLAERVFVQVLLHSEGDLADAPGPIAIPIFGRGRALYALVDKGITGENVVEACAFLVGRCSCEAKAENPGRDLLMSAPWASRAPTRLVEEIELPPLTALPESMSSPATKPAPGSRVAPPARVSPQPRTATGAEAGASSNGPLRNTLAAVAMAFAVLAGAALIVKRRVQSPGS